MDIGGPAGRCELELCVDLEWLFGAAAVAQVADHGAGQRVHLLTACRVERDRL
jgi:hypothetical protein